MHLEKWDRHYRENFKKKFHKMKWLNLYRRTYTEQHELYSKWLLLVRVCKLAYSAAAYTSLFMVYGILRHQLLYITIRFRMVIQPNEAAPRASIYILGARQVLDVSSYQNHCFRMGSREDERPIINYRYWYVTFRIRSVARWPVTSTVARWPVTPTVTRWPVTYRSPMTSDFYSSPNDTFF